MTDKFDDAFQQADAENTGQRVYYTLQELNQYPEATRKRWGWELLQNAHDARQIEDKREIIVEIKYEQEELVFSHNGRGFSASEIAHLIRSGSTKNETDETTYGQYGTGLLTTHLLSQEIQISGQLDDGKNWFDFYLVRDDDSPEALLKSLDKAKDAFKHSVSQNKPSHLGDLTTCFRIPIIEEDAKRSVKTGIETLKKCAPYVLIFNETFRSISIKDHENTLCFEVVDYPESKLDMPQKISVIEHNNEKIKKREYLLAQGKKKTSVVVPLKSQDEGVICLPVEETPRLFKGFPLVGTEFFGFPAVINSSNFTVTSDRDSVPLDEDSEVNQTNLEIIEEACALLVGLVDYAASNKWRYLPRWLNVPLTENQSSPSIDWLRKCVRGNLIEKVRQTSVILNADNNRISPEKGKLPLADSKAGVEALWDLYAAIKKQREFLPKREEATEWCNTVNSWADVYQSEPMSSFKKEVRNGQRLALDIQEHTRKDCKDDDEWGTITDLQDLLRDGVSAIEWLNQLHDFLIKNGFREAVREYHIVPDQTGCLDKLSALHRDPGIDEELKEIAETLGESIREELRDIRLISLSEEEGRGDMTQDKVVDILHQTLLNRADENPDSHFKEASRRFFAWIVNQRDYPRLHGFPVFAEDADSDAPRVIHLPRPTQDNVLDSERPLGPIKSWSNDLQDYAELFPRRHIVANVFFEDISDPDVWQTLEKDGLVRRDVIIRDCREVSFEELQSCSPLMEKVNHESEKKIVVTNIAFLNKKDIGVIDRVRKSRPLAYKFWRFLTEWLIFHDSEGVETIIEACTCKETHQCYPAQWLKLVVDRKWVPLGKDLSDIVKPETLATLLRGSNWDPNSLSENHPVAKLLEAIGVSRFDLIRQAATENDDTRVAVDNAFIEMLAKTGGNISNLNHAIEYIEALRDDDDLPNVLAERKERKRIVRENQDLGQKVENWVKENLEQKNFDGKGFTVERTGKGSDFEMEDTDGITTLNVAKEGRKWLIEVKATRTAGDHQSVRMTSTQAQTAVDKKEKFLLCVVPLGQEDVTPETVRENMYFIQNIGDSIAPLWKGLKSLRKKPADIDIILDVEEGKAGILVKKSVWESHGFAIEELAERLRKDD